MSRRAVLRMPERLREEDGNMTVLTSGVLGIVLLAIGVGTALTGVHLERKELQAMADGAALYAVSRVGEDALYGGGVPADGAPDRRALPLTEDAVRAAAEAYLADYPRTGGRTSHPVVSDVALLGDGTAEVTLAAVTDPPLVGWLTDAADAGVRLGASATATAF
jgi:hypothetical protein